MCTWKYEAIFVGSLLMVVAYLSGSHITDWLGATAVLLTFMHGQISFDFQDAQGQMMKLNVSCYRWSGRYFVTKEILWVVTFALMQAWPLLVGTIVFLTYPKWRKVFREWINSRMLQSV